jgi:hypothetical protein
LNDPINNQAVKEKGSGCEPQKAALTKLLHVQPASTTDKHPYLPPKIAETR